MTSASPRGSPVVAAFPRSLSSILVSIGGLALFLIFASWLLVSSPIGSTVSGYLYDYPNKAYFPELNHTVVDLNLNDKGVKDEVPFKSSSQVSMKSDGTLGFRETEKPMDQPAHGYAVSSNLTKENEVDAGSVPETEKTTGQPARDYIVPSNLTKENEVDVSSVSSNVTVAISNGDALPQGLSNNSVGMDIESNDTTTVQASSDAKLGVSQDLFPLPSNTTKNDSGCDLYRGNWFYDSAGPSYTNNTCPVVTQMQNCQGNGRPDKEYESWRWKPFECDLPRFDGRKFLNLMRGKTLAFIGDSVARNQMESLICLLWQVEVPKNRGNRKMQRWQFKSTSTMIVRIWSSWLVHRTSEKFDYAPEGIDKLHLDAPDETFMELAPTFDVIVLSSGHWFAKQSVYILNNEIVGGQLWWPPKGSPPFKVSNIEAFGISVDTVLTALVTHPNYTGLTIVRSFSPDHYEGGAWNTGGSCTGKVKPLAPGELIENGFTNIMHEKQVAGFNRAIKKATNRSKLKLMDITEAFGYRHDGHPGPYRSPDPNKLTKRRVDGTPPPQDCLHWCMPGPVDTWNELVLEIMRRAFQEDQGT